MSTLAGTTEPNMLDMKAKCRFEAARAVEGKPATLPRFRTAAQTGGPMRVDGCRT